MVMSVGGHLAARKGLKKMSNQVDHEVAFINTFVARDHRERYLMKLKKPEHRRKFLDVLNHSLLYIDALATPMPRLGKTDVETLLRERGAGDLCHIISAVPELDGLELPLREALDRVHRVFPGSVICCLPGRLAYYKAEDSDSIILEKRLSQT
jgi:hypothetical protein